ncbi:hypothetical protein ABET51_02810 [Metabacillus fastidiosus]|uniref:hypothetical protein n=1 Tax=Metabacillus fastidiosus TaxID=1458 RepID=UPI003D2BE8E2
MKKHNIETIQLEKNPVIEIILHFFDKLKTHEKDFMSKQSLFHLCLARFISIIGILFAVYLLSFLFIYIGFIVGQMYFPTHYGFSVSNWLAMPLVVGLPLLLKVLSNFTNRDYLFSEQAINLLQTFQYSHIKVSSFRFAFEIIFFILFIAVYSILLIHVLTNFLNVNFISNLINNSPLQLVTITLSVIVYLTIRILLMEESTPFSSYLKAKRTFYLWLFAAVFICIFLIQDLISTKTVIPLKFLYAGVAILIAIDRIRNSYQALKEQLEKYLNPDDNTSN